MIWLDMINQLTAKSVPHVLITVLSVEGSAPRAAGAKMVVDEHRSFDTVGGGNLEFQAISDARQWLRACEVERVDSGIRGEAVIIRQKNYTLGTDLSQCCGGRVVLLFEIFLPRHDHIAVFGAGHVGQALVQILCQLPCRLELFDSRAEFLELAIRQVPASHREHLITRIMPFPALAVEECPAGTRFVVLTHSHDIDFELIEAILSRASPDWCGLIASASKASKFKQRLARKGFSKEEVSRLTAPIGLPEIAARQPMAVAVSIAAQLLQQTTEQC